VADNQWWLDPTSAWQLKLARAQYHIDALAAEAEAFVSAGTYSAVAEPGTQPGETVYRLQMSKPIPLHFSTVIGDALHNLRSALDCAACELARRHVGRPLSEEEERACAFPIDGDPAKIQKFLNEKPRLALYGPGDRQRVGAVQPGWLYDHAVSLGVGHAGPTREEEVAHDDLTLLNRLSNVDKHRRVHLVTSWPDLVYWGSNAAVQQRWTWGRPPFEDGAVLGTLYQDPGHPEPAPQTLHHEMQLRAFDPPEAGGNDIVTLLRSMRREVAGRVIPGVFRP